MIRLHPLPSTKLSVPNKKPAEAGFSSLWLLKTYLPESSSFSIHKKNRIANTAVPTAQTVAMMAIFFSSPENYIEFKLQFNL